MEGDKNKAKVIERPGISGGQSAQHVLRDVYSGVATLLALCAGLTCRLTLRVLWMCGLYFVPAGLTTSVSHLSALCRSVGTTLVKEPYRGQIAFPRIYLWRGGLSPFLFTNFSKDINVTYKILIPLFLGLHLKHSKSF